MTDPINPDHYKRLPAEAIEIIESAIENAPSNQDAYLHGQVLKYVLRCWNKNGIEDLKKAKWYLDRLVDSLDEREKQKAADQQSLKDHPFGKPKTASLNSDKIPEGYRKLGDSSVEPRQLGDLRWSVTKKRYVKMSVQEIGYANRDNWAACRKVTGEVKAPDGWRFLEHGEVIRDGDEPIETGLNNAINSLVGLKLQPHWMPVIRRNKFNVGEKVVHGTSTSQSISVVASILDDDWVDVVCDGDLTSYHVKDLAPYIEDAK